MGVPFDLCFVSTIDLDVEISLIIRENNQGGMDGVSNVMLKFI